jgi:hypothetical protein
MTTFSLYTLLPHLCTHVHTARPPIVTLNIMAYTHISHVPHMGTTCRVSSESLSQLRQWVGCGFNVRNRTPGGPNHAMQRLQVGTACKADQFHPPTRQGCQKIAFSSTCLLPLRSFLPPLLGWTALVEAVLAVVVVLQHRRSLLVG